MREFLWGKIILKTVVLALFPVIIGILGSIAIAFPNIVWYLATGILIMLYVLYLWGNCLYEKKQKVYQEWFDSITKLCREECSLVKAFADSIHQKVRSKVGHTEVTDWPTLKRNCDIICKVVYEFIQNIALSGNQFSVSVFFKRMNEGKNEYNMLSRVSYDNHNPASYNVFRSEEEVSKYFYKKMFDEAKTRPTIFPTKQEIEAAFYNCDGVNYSQYIGIPVACLGNRMIAILQIVSYNNSLIAKTRDDIEKMVDDYLCTYANLILLADKVENATNRL